MEEIYEKKNMDNSVGCSYGYRYRCLALVVKQCIADASYKHCQ